jgi:hypothetical protein
MYFVYLSEAMFKNKFFKKFVNAANAAIRKNCPANSFTFAETSISAPINAGVKTSFFLVFFFTIKSPKRL